MKIIVDERQAVDEIEVIIRCNKVTDEVKNIIKLLDTSIAQIKGRRAGCIRLINISEIYYLESVDKKTFLYTEDKVYEIKERLYMIVEMLKNKGFIRISKSMIVNLMYVRGIKPKINKRLILNLENKEKLIVSRSFVDEFKRELGM
ncbi:LytTR family DNA-binding domain-containing protein [uncultured Clostridium sp.]|uniref:LytTR family DNA-binding domain-containing protein n=1 Tax=uncultured Clostridium sp. TaxID=59620 RepID=UPI002620DA27|nr:LytTR family DNA-binding domain-containing protein [uncultured Clostridium sp.]